MKNRKGFTDILESIKMKLVSLKFSSKMVFIITGMVSTVWFLVRVLPKPQRAGYPCMRAAAPVMSGFVIYLLTLAGSAIFFKNAYSKFMQAKFWPALLSIVICFVFFFAFSINDAKKSQAATTITKITWDTVLPDGHNNPMGVGQGVFPGRVAWVWNPAATDENCTQQIDDAFFMPVNNNQDTVNSMADKSIKKIGGQNSVKDSWDAIFKYFNKRKTGNEAGYATGQTIFIKVNNGQAGWAINSDDLSETGEGSAMTGKSNIAIAETTPVTVLAFVRQLVDSCGIPQTSIYIGEPMTHVFKSMNDLIHSKYPDVKVMDKDGNTSLGRTKSTGWTSDCIFYSDKGTVMTNAISDDMMQEMYNADYLINICALKAHARGGMTLTAKLHFGSHGTDKHGDSFHLHQGLISTVDNDVLNRGVRGSYHMYRVLTDLMTHPKLGRNTVLYVVDGLWGGIEATDMPVKWKIAPFNNDWPSSLFVSQDEVAVQSVCLDFLRAEASVNTLFNNRPLFPAIDDFLHQAADSSNWPKGIKYDPGKTGTYIASLGVHEHWNNATDKQYTKDLYSNGTGIDLVSIPESLVNHENTMLDVSNLNIVDNLSVYPNPSNYQSTISYHLKKNSNVSVFLITMNGTIVKNIRQGQLYAGNYNDKIDVQNLKTGMYICVLQTSEGIKTTKLEVR
jgi:hypothetical protein